VELSGYALTLAQQSAESRDTVRSNRRLLDEAFDGLIKRDIMDRAMTALIVQVMAISILLAGFSNIGIVYFTKELEFNKRVILEMSTQLVSTIVTIVLAFVYRNVWAMVFGRLTGVVCGLALSYVMHPYRPRLSFDISRAKELWGFGKHIFGMTILRFLYMHGDDVFLGKMLGATALGFYQQAFKIGTMVSTEIGGKIQTVAFPVYSKLRDNVPKVRSGYFKVINTTTLIVFPVAGGLIALAPEITEVVFGAKWLPMVPAMRILCLFGPLKCMQRASVFMAMGRPDILTRLMIIKFLLMAVSIYPLTVKWGMVGTSFCVLGADLIIQPFGLYELQKLIDAKARDVLKTLSFPFFATLAMMLGVYLTKIAIGSAGAFRLIFLVVTGGVIYSVFLLLASRFSSKYDALALIRDVAKGLKS
jgi:O-antigen/teichoic acid export membrane protein